MQIKEIILYSYSKKSRRIKFNLGEVNIISGESKTGKSAIGDIIDYCLCSRNYDVAKGIITETVEWYALLLQFSDKQIFLARKAPQKGRKSSTEFYFEIGKEIEPYESSMFEPNTNLDKVKDLLAKEIGINEAIKVFQNNQSNDLTGPSFRQSLIFCFLNQNEIATKEFLFHRQSDSFVAQTFKYTFPYFLGIINEDVVSLENNRKKIKKELSQARASLDNSEFLYEKRKKSAIRLIMEARQIGLIKEEPDFDNCEYMDLYNFLKKLSSIEMSEISINSKENLSKLLELQEKLEKKREEINDLVIRLREMKNYVIQTNHFTDEAGYQKRRLETINLFEQLNFEEDKCPFCSQPLEQKNPSLEMLKHSIESLDESIGDFTKESALMDDKIKELEKEINLMKKEQRQIEEEIKGIQAQEEEFKKYRDTNILVGKLIGRISEWMESQKNEIEIEKQKKYVEDLEEQLYELNKRLEEVYIEEKKQHVLSFIQGEMTKGAVDLNLENNQCPFRLDLNRLTAVFDTEKEQIFLKQMGSGANWVGSHLVSYFSLHKWLVNNDRPVPNFLFLDQPSQVYYPSSSDEQKTDMEQVKKMYEYMIKKTQELDGKLQIIIVDHVGQDEEFLQKYICEKWWGKGKALIPEDWY